MSFIGNGNKSTKILLTILLSDRNGFSKEFRFFECDEINKYFYPCKIFPDPYFQTHSSADIPSIVTNRFISVMMCNVNGAFVVKGL